MKSTELLHNMRKAPLPVILYVLSTLCWVGMLVSGRVPLMLVALLALSACLSTVAAVGFFRRTERLLGSIAVMTAVASGVILISVGV
jgi:hypothetical protein